MRMRPSLKISICILCIITGAAAVFMVTGMLNAAAYKQIIEDQTIGKIIIDPGHGGPDGGAVGIDGAIEKYINLSISLKLRSFLLSSGFQVIMTREDDRTISDENCTTLRSMKTSDLHNRLKIANENPDAIFISIHQNIYTESYYSGAQVFYSQNNEESKYLAGIIQQDIIDMLQPENTRKIKPAQDNLYILYNVKSPAVLVECGFLSNYSECKKLQDDSYQNKIAFAIYYSVLQYYSTDSSSQ